MRKAPHNNEPTETGDDTTTPPPIVTPAGDAEAPSADELKELKAKAAKADENWERVVRTAADFENFKKRAAREKQDAIKFANESLIKKLVGVLDNFEMAQAAAGSNSA